MIDCSGPLPVLIALSACLVLLTYAYRAGWWDRP